MERRCDIQRIVSPDTCVLAYSCKITHMSDHFHPIFMKNRLELVEIGAARRGKPKNGSRRLAAGGPRGHEPNRVATLRARRGRTYQDHVQRRRESASGRHTWGGPPRGARPSPWSVGENHTKRHAILKKRGGVARRKPHTHRKEHARASIFILFVRNSDQNSRSNALARDRGGGLRRSEGVCEVD